jgi:hypothetical protein
VNVWSGALYFVDVRTVDGRLITPGKLRFDLPVPLVRYSHGSSDLATLGTIDRVEEVVHVGIAWGKTTLPPGNYPVGLDVGDVTEEFEVKDEEAEGTMTGGRIMGAHVLDNDSAWRGAWITVHHPEVGPHT